MTDLLPVRPGLPTPSRRAILGAAWTAPVVVAASAAPTYAASSSATLTFDTLVTYASTWSGSNPTAIETKVQVQHVYAATSPTVTGLTVTVVFPATAATGGKATFTGDSWLQGAVSGSAKTSWSYAFSWTGTLKPSESTPQLVFVVPRQAGKQQDTTITAYATATQAPTVTRTASAQL